MERREFLKVGAMAAAGGAAMTVLAPTNADASTGTTKSTVAGIELSKVGVREITHEEFYELNDVTDDIENFSSLGMTPFGQGAMKNPGFEGCWDWEWADVTPIIGKAGYDYKDKAMHHCNPDLLDATAYQYWPPTPMGPDGERYEFESPDEAQDLLLRAGYFMGASEVGIAPFDSRLCYASGLSILEGLKEEYGWEPKSVVCIAYQMNREVLMLTPLVIANGGSFQGYAQIALQSWQVASVINNLGYGAYPSLLTIAPGVGYAALAGLGEIGRPGMLINPRLGMNMRLVEVFTDIEATPTNPIEFGVQDFCIKCKKCADACPSGAVSTKDYREQANTEADCTNQSFNHWAIDGEKCLSFWTENHADCATCMMSCPFTKEENWLHQGVRIMAGTVPGMHNIAREMDDLFGYGAHALEDTEAAAADFWDRRPEEIWKDRR